MASDQEVAGSSPAGRTKTSFMERKNLKQLQAYVAKTTKKRGFDNETSPEKVMLFLEECGEMAKAIRKKETTKYATDSKEHRLDFELADVFFYLLDICNKFKIDLEKAFLEKESINEKRKWK